MLFVVASIARLGDFVSEFRELDPYFTFKFLFKKHSLGIRKIIVVSGAPDSLIKRVEIWYLSEFIHLDTPFSPKAS